MAKEGEDMKSVLQDMVMKAVTKAKSKSKGVKELSYDMQDIVVDAMSKVKPEELSMDEIKQEIQNLITDVVSKMKSKVPVSELKQEIQGLVMDAVSKMEEVPDEMAAVKLEEVSAENVQDFEAGSVSEDLLKEKALIEAIDSVMSDIVQSAIKQYKSGDDVSGRSKTDFEKMIQDYIVDSLKALKSTEEITDEDIENITYSMANIGKLFPGIDLKTIVTESVWKALPLARRSAERKGYILKDYVRESVGNILPSLKYHSKLRGVDMRSIVKDALIEGFLLSEVESESRGANLCPIMRELTLHAMPDKERQKLLQIIREVSNSLKRDIPSMELTELLHCLKDECDKSLAHKVVASNNGVYSIVLTSLEMYSDNRYITFAAFDTLLSLTYEQTDLLDQRGINLMIDFLDNQPDAATHERVFKWIKHCCWQNEFNRLDLFNSGILAHLKRFLQVETSTKPLVVEVCRVIRALTLDDDIHVTCGTSHERSARIADEVAPNLVQLMRRFKNDKEVVMNLLMALTACFVKFETSKEMATAGGMRILLNIFMKFDDSELIQRLIIKLLKAMACNYSVKNQMITAGVVPLIIDSMANHKTSAPLLTVICECIAALSFQSAENSKLFIEAGAASMIISGMNTHSKDPMVQKQGSFAIRNIISRNPEFAKIFLEMRAEEVLRTAIYIHEDTCDYDAMAALKELGCKIDFKERWLGTGGALH